MMPLNRWFFYFSPLFFLLFGLFSNCAGPSGNPNALFRSVPAAKSGIDFANTILESDTFNVLTFTYIYNGSGVGIGDFNNDGLPDLFFGGNQTSCRIYLNRGGLKFEDISDKAGILTDRWCTGIALADINGDGLLDAYVSAANPNPARGAANYCFINLGPGPDGLPRFADKAREMGIADTGYSTQAAFFDFDKDGYLDMYLLTNGLDDPSRNTPRINRHEGRYPSTDRLYRNNGDGTFTNVSAEAGILTEGWGLGVAIADINNDGWPDVYVANDFLSDDILYLNNGDGSFSNRTGDFFRRLSYNGMGVDIADFNNDELPDVAVLDMMPEDNRRQKSMFGKPNHDRVEMNIRQGYLPQYVRNSLQLNNGDGTFSEIGQMAGMYATDWSWTPLFADFDNDGLRDLLITNGYHRDVTDLDYVTYSSNASIFGSDRSKLETLYAAVKALGGVKKHNYFFRNRGDLTFEDVSAAWGFTMETYSNGAAFADLDLDGDLDLVINNLNDKAMLMENRATQRTANHYVRVQLQGPDRNPFGQGAKVWVRFRDSTGREHTLFQEQNLYRGYKSTMEPTLHFGLGKAGQAGQVEVVWPDGKRQQVTSPPADAVIYINYQEATPAPAETASPPAPPLPARPANLVGIDAFLAANDHIDFKLEPLLMRKYSQNGPGMAIGDMDGNGLPDLLVGGGPRKPALMFFQQPGGQFTKRVFPGPDSVFHDMGLLLFDADGDGDQDLYVASGGNERRAGLPYYRHRFYRNDGRGNFTPDTLAIRDIRESGSVVVATDFDGDGDLDLFVGGRLTPGLFPQVPQSFLLRNDNGRFHDVTDELAPGLSRAGLVSAALWTDVNTDGQPDLMVTGEYMPVRIWLNEGGRLVEKTEEAGLNAFSGWWNSLLQVDIDLDGDPDYVAGNFGLNHRFQPDPDKAVIVTANDYDKNGSYDAVTTFFIKDDYYAAHPRDALIDQIVGIRVRFPRYEVYGRTPAHRLFTPEEREGELRLQANWFASSVLINLGNGRFEVHALPMLAQTAPLFGIQATDLNGDNLPDLLLTGNLFGAEPQMGPYDAFYGLALLGDGKGGFAPLRRKESGFFVPGDARSLVTLPVAGRRMVVSAAHSGPLRVFDTGPDQAVWVSAQPQDLAFRLYFPGGRIQWVDVPYGSGYLSQSARGHWAPAAAERVEAIGPGGVVREIKLPRI